MYKILILLIFASSLFATDKIAVAVNDLTAHNIGESEASIISDRVRSELINTNKYRVMERGEMDMILQEQGFQESGMCTDASCLVEVGQMLAVEQIISGSIGLIGDMYTITLKVVNVESGEIEATGTVDYHGKITGLLSEGVNRVVRKLMNKNGGGENGSGYLSVFSSPDGAIVSVNGNSIGETPLNKSKVSSGKLGMLISKKHFVTIDTTFYISSGDDQSFTFALTPEKTATPKKNKVFKILGFSIGGSMIVAGVLAGTSFNKQIEELQHDYDSSTNPGEISDLRNQMDDAVLYRNISYIGAGTGAALVTVSFFF